MILQELERAGIGFEAGFKSPASNQPMLLMIHGAGGRAQVWRNQVYPLKASLNTLALDLPGHGNSSGRAKETIDEYAQWLWRSLKPIFRNRLSFWVTPWGAPSCSRRHWNTLL
jgi:pimeloyl-ACP methyl ester carboxylesterase